ncbi:MAG: hypothetical protein K0S93_78 [Nitrososphaeraceae archaeon]|nr:hypothetical protein [Nitrososphaeraceae archaeon]
MNSLREEIYEYLGNDKITTDEIISKIEKRIDSIIHAKVSKSHVDQYSWESRNIDEIVGLLREVKEILK